MGLGYKTFCNLLLPFLKVKVEFLLTLCIWNHVISTSKSSSSSYKLLNLIQCEEASSLVFKALKEESSFLLEIVEIVVS